MVRWERSYWFSTSWKFFVGFCFLLELKKIVWQNTLESLPQSLITTTPKSTNSFPIGTITKRRKKANLDKTNIGVGTSFTVKVGDINKNIREGGSRRMMKDMVGCLAHIASVLVLYKFWWLVPVFYLQMMNSRWGLLRNYHTRIDNFVPLIRLSTL